MSDQIPAGERRLGERSLTVWIYPLAWIVGLVLTIYFFSAVSTVMLGVLAASIIACTLNPLVERIPGPRGVNVAILGVGMLAAVAALVFAFSWQLRNPISKAIEKWPDTAARANETLSVWSNRIGLEPPLRVERMVSGLGDFLAGTGGQQLFSRSADLFLGVLISMALTVIGSIFILSDPPAVLLRPGLRLLSPRHQAILGSSLADLAPRFRRWVLGTVTGMCVVFVASSLGYTMIGLELAIPLALLAGIAEVVPTVGPAFACAVATLLTLATESGAKAAGVLVVCAIIQGFEAYVILPMIMRGAVNIHPAVTLFTVVLWGKIFGVPGLILAIPINLIIWTLLTHYRGVAPAPVPQSTGDSIYASKPTE